MQGYIDRLGDIHQGLATRRATATLDEADVSLGHARIDGEIELATVPRIAPVL